MSQMEREHPLECIQRQLRRYISRFDCILFVGMFAATLLVHFYMFTHKFINHDDIGALYTRGEYGIYSARWLIAPLTKLTGSFSSSWINGLVGAFFLAAAVVLIARIFRIRRYVPAFLMGVCLVSFPVVAATYSYMCGAGSYFFALFSAVLSAYLIQSNRLPLMAAGSVMVALAMGCYQAYFCLPVTLLIVAVGLDLLDDRFGGSWKRVFLTGVKYVAFLAAGMVLYFIILKICLHVQGVTLVSYQGLDTLGQLKLGQLPGRVIDAYEGFVKFVGNAGGVFHIKFRWVLCIAVAFAAAEFVFEVVKKKLWRSPATMVFLAVVILLFPLGCCLVYVMVDSAVAGVHLLMLYPMAILFVLPAIALDRFMLPASRGGKTKERLCVLFALVLLIAQAAIGYECILISNRAYFIMDVTYENTYAFYTKLTAKVELQEGYTDESQVAFIGVPTVKDHAPSSNMTGILNLNSALNMYTVPEFLKYLLASNYSFVSVQREAELSGTPEFQDMPIYPAEGSIKTVDGVIVVKLS